MLPGACFGLVVLLILVRTILGLTGRSPFDLLDILIQVALAAGLFYPIVSGTSSLWSIVEVAGGIRMERDGAILYEGPIDGLHVAGEAQGVMLLRSGDGSAFQFPRRRVFHEVLSRIEESR
jgi:hypothetical protein